MKRMFCVLLCAVSLTAVGCGARTPSNNSVAVMSAQDVTEAPTVEIKTVYGETATYGNMTVTVNTVEDPEIVMDTGRKALFFNVTITNNTEETVMTNYINNFSLTVDGTYHDATDCFTIPVMQELYNFYGEEAFKAEIAPGETVTGYLAAEVNPNFSEMSLHYTPKTTDRGSRVTVELTSDNVTAASKS